MNTWLRYRGVILPILIVAALALWPIITGKAANRESAFTILKAVALASSLNILLGYTGYVSFGHIVFYGFGGYVGLFLLTDQGWSLWSAILAGGFASGLLAFLLGTAILRLRGAYFALATIGINEAMKAFINNFPLFGGPTGINNDSVGPVVLHHFGNGLLIGNVLPARTSVATSLASRDHVFATGAGLKVETSCLHSAIRTRTVILHEC